MKHTTTFRQKDNGWQIIISYKDGDRWRQKSRQGFARKSDAKEAEAELLREYLLRSGRTQTRAAEVLGVDIDREAVRVARENFQKNHVEDICRAEYGDLTRGVDFKADLIAGNLMAELICMLAEGVYAHLAEDGLFIASGILTEKEQMVTEALQAAGFRIVESRTKGEWCALAAARPRG